MQTTGERQKRANWLVRPLVAVVAVGGLALAFLFPAPLLSLSRLAGYAVCHQWPEHSFAAQGQAFPLCARCTGTFTGVLLALGLISLRGRGRAGDWPVQPVLALVVAGFALMVFDGANSFVDVASAGSVHLYASNNALRFITGGLSGVALMALGYPLLSYALWNRWERMRSVASLREWAGLTVALLVALALAASSTRFALVAFSLAGLAGSLLMFTGANAGLWLLITGKQGRAQTLADALPMFGAGLGLTLAEWLLIGVGRHLLETYVAGLG